MAFIDGSIVNIALPVIQRDFNATSTDMQWVVEVYLLFLSALILVGGSLGDRYGRRNIFAGGVVLFTAASAWWTGPTRALFARGVQGIGAHPFQAVFHYQRLI
jgi:MFS family permease